MIVMMVSCKNNSEIKPIVEDIKELVFASGQLEWDDAYNLTAQTDGILENGNFEVGTKVQKDDVLASIKNKSNDINIQSAQEQLKIANENVSENSPAIQQLQTNIQFAEAKYNQDKLNAERYQRLFDNQTVSKVQNENMQLTAKNSLSNLTALKKQQSQILQQAQQQKINAQAQLENNAVLRSYNNIVAFQEGTVIRKLKNNGDYVRKGDVIATIANEKKIKAVLNVDENSISKIKIGQQVFVKLNIEKEKTLNAKVSKILAAFDQQTQSFLCEITFEDALKTTLFGTQLEANILIGEKKNALLIPRNYMGYGNIVNVKGQNETRSIKTGIISSEYVEVIDGLTKEDVLLPLKP